MYRVFANDCIFWNLHFSMNIWSKVKYFLFFRILDTGLLDLSNSTYMSIFHMRNITPVNQWVQSDFIHVSKYTLINKMLPQASSSIFEGSTKTENMVFMQNLWKSVGIQLPRVKRGWWDITMDWTSIDIIWSAQTIATNFSPWKNFLQTKLFLNRFKTLEGERTVR